MPEALAILIVVIARFAGTLPSVAEERERLTQRIAWLENRSAHARQKGCDGGMRGRIEGELVEEQQRLAALERAR